MDLIKVEIEYVCDNYIDVSKTTAVDREYILKNIYNGDFTYKEKDIPDTILVPYKKITDKIKKLGIGNEIKSLKGKLLVLKRRWSKHGAKNKTPKTDGIIGSSFNVSIKLGECQLMSAKKEEQKATFLNLDFAGKNDKEFKRLISMIDNFNVIRINGTVKENYDNSRIGFEKIKMKEVKFLLNQLLKQYKELKHALIKEAMTGEKKFGKNSPGCANYILKVFSDGEHFIFREITDEFIDEILNFCHVTIDLKSSGERKWPALRIIWRDKEMKELIYK